MFESAYSTATILLYLHDQHSDEDPPNGPEMTPGGYLIHLDEIGPQGTNMAIARGCRWGVITSNR